MTNKFSPRYIILIAPLLFISICRGQTKASKEKEEDKVIDMIARLPEVIKTDDYCKKLSKGKRHLVTMIGGYPSTGENYYLVKVAEDNGTAFHTWFLFAVYPKSYKIEYYDTMNDRYIPLRIWRKHYKEYL
jgi:hypothetical protein